MIRGRDVVAPPERDRLRLVRARSRRTPVRMDGIAGPDLAIVPGARAAAVDLVRWSKTCALSPLARGECAPARRSAVVLQFAERAVARDEVERIYRRHAAEREHRRGQHRQFGSNASRAIGWKSSVRVMPRRTRTRYSGT
ncbi:MAG: hypothetical protein J0H86_09845 [Xanthomonadaceae bacterium]|nr:hypothetical protein [Xanthomonadaceae bacterium]